MPRPPTRSPRSTCRTTSTSRRRYAGVVVKASPNVDAAHAFLDWFAGPDGQAILAELRVPAARVVTSATSSQPAGEAVARRPPVRRRAEAGATASVVLVAAPSRCSSGCPSSPSSSGRSSTARSSAAVSSEVVLTALALSLATTAVSLVLVVVFGLPLAFVLARRRFRGQWLVEAVVDLPIVLPPSVAGLALLLVFGRRGIIGETLGVVGHRDPVHGRRRRPRPDVRGGAVLHPLRARRASSASTARSRTRPASTGPRSGTCSGGSPCRSPPGRWPPGSS